MGKFNNRIEGLKKYIERNLTFTTNAWNSISRVLDLNSMRKLPFWDNVSLAEYLGISLSTLTALVRSQCADCYKTYYIDKETKRIVPRTYPGNLREINAPVEGLKELQVLLAKLFKDFSYHPANFGFIGGRSILSAAENLKDGETLIHIDLEKFFDNHSTLYVSNKLNLKFKEKYGEELPKDVMESLLTLLTLNGCLPQGSPASPILVVILNEEMDKRIQDVADKYKLIYSRYADDLGFSGSISNSDANEFISDLEDAVQPFQINFKKLGIMRHTAKPFLKEILIHSDAGFKSAEVNKVRKAAAAEFEGVNIKCTVKSEGRLPKDIIIRGKGLEDIDRDDVNTKIDNLHTALNEAFTTPIVVKAKFFYVQHTKRFLGLNIQDGKVNIPRKRFNELRLIAMLMGRQRAIKAAEHAILDRALDSDKDKLMDILGCFSNLTMNTLFTTQFRNLKENPMSRKVFNGNVSYIRSVDPTKADKLVSVENASNARCKEQLIEWFRNCSYGGFARTL